MPVLSKFIRTATFNKGHITWTVQERKDGIITVVDRNNIGKITIKNHDFDEVVTVYLDSGAQLINCSDNVHFERFDEKTRKTLI